MATVSRAILAACSGIYILTFLIYLRLRLILGDGVWWLALLNNFAFVLFAPLPAILLGDGSWPVSVVDELPGFLPPLLRVDYVWHSDHFRALEAKRGPRLGSDHLPVYAVLELPAE